MIQANLREVLLPVDDSGSSHDQKAPPLALWGINFASSRHRVAVMVTWTMLMVLGGVYALPFMRATSTTIAAPPGTPAYHALDRQVTGGAASLPHCWAPCCPLQPAHL